MLSDQKTVLGVHFKIRNVIFKENIADKHAPLVTYDSSNYRVYSLVVREDNNCFFVGGKAHKQRRGNILQYDLDTGRLLRDFRLVDLQSIMSNCRYHELCFFGTFDHDLIVLDSIKRLQVHQPLRTAIKHIDGLELGVVGLGDTGSKTLLFVSGRKRDYSRGKTDVFDVTELIRKHAIC